MKSVLHTFSNSIYTDIHGFASWLCRESCLLLWHIMFIATLYAATQTRTELNSDPFEGSDGQELGNVDYIQKHSLYLSMSTTTIFIV